MSHDRLEPARNRIGERIHELHKRAARLSPLEIYARMDSIRQLAAEHGLAALEGLAERTAQLALLPGHRVATLSCLEHAEEALESTSPADRQTILAAVAVRLN